VDGNGLAVTILELAKPQELVESWAATPGTGLDPFGLVLWPGAQFAARLLCERREDVQGASVLVLGAGTGLEALTAAALGARRVTAVDIHSLPLALLSDAAQMAGLADVVQTLTLDLTSDEPLPEGHEIHLCKSRPPPRHTYSARLLCWAPQRHFCADADVLYAGDLAEHVARRCAESLAQAVPERGGQRRVIVTDSQQFRSGGKFLDRFNAMQGSTHEWHITTLSQFTGSGLLIEDDQTYDATVRYLDLGGWEWR
jgi:predicted nicotinamide N-methyase